MLAKKESWQYNVGTKIWIGIYKNSKNLLHWHHDCELIYVLNGKLDVFYEKQNYSLSKGQAFFIDSGKVHFFNYTEPDTKLITLIFDPSVCSSFTSNKELSSPLLTSYYDVMQTYLDLKEEFIKKRAFYEIKIEQILSSLLLDIYRNEELILRTNNEKSSNRFKELLSKIEQDYEFESLESCAEFMSMNPSYFSRYFHQTAGTSFSNYLNTVKIERAIELISTQPNITMTEVAQKCGFYTIRNFNRTFKKYTDHTPKKLPKEWNGDKVLKLDNKSEDPSLTDCELLECSENFT